MTSWAHPGRNGFSAPFEIRADRFGMEGTRFPYAKFPRDPEGFDRITPFIVPGVFPFSFDPARLANISMRLSVGDGEKLMVGGFMIEGAQPKRVVVRAMGPSLAHAGVRQRARRSAARVEGRGGKQRRAERELARIAAGGIARDRPRA